MNTTNSYRENNTVYSTGLYSHAEGYSTTASNTASHARSEERRVGKEC